MLDQIIRLFFNVTSSIEERQICSGGLNLSSRHVAIGLACEYQAAVPPRYSPLRTLSRAKRSQRRGETAVFIGCHRLDGDIIIILI